MNAIERLAAKFCRAPRRPAAIYISKSEALDMIREWNDMLRMVGKAPIVGIPDDMQIMGIPLRVLELQ